MFNEKEMFDSVININDNLSITVKLLIFNQKIF